MAAASAVSGLIERLEYLLLAEGAPAKCEGDLKKGVVQLQSELGKVEQFLSDADARNNICVGDLKKSLTQLVHQIEDDVESYVVQETAPKGKLGIVKSLINRSAASRIQEDLRRSIDELHKYFTAAQKDAAAGSGKISSSSTSSSTSHVFPGAEPKPNFQIMRDDTESLKSILLQGPSHLSVVPICGMGGIGKTTLARSIYNDPSVAYHFDTRAWATVDMEFQARDVLETILFSLVPSRSKDQIARMETMELMDQLYKAQKGRRYLVVLDDVWSNEAWDSLKFAFPDDNNGSRIVITTRNKEVGAYAAPAYIHEMSLLVEDKSWELFKINSGLAHLPDMELNPEMEKTGKQIVKYCRGLPLAIIVMGSSLRGKSLEYWEKILQSMQRDQNSESNILDILSLSYNHLPFHLKPCFLYLGHFPPDQPIPVEKLYLLWMAEGLISTRSGNNKTRIELAEDYFIQLLDRNLIILAEKEEVSTARTFKSCQIHDLIRDLSRQKGKQEEFFEVIDFVRKKKISPSTCKLAIYLNESEDVLSNMPESKHMIRSMLFFDSTDESLPAHPTWPKEFSDLKEFQKLRVLNFDGVDFQVKMLPKGIEKLILLRHLSFHGCYLHEFPSSLSNFPLLETLDLRVRVSCVMTIPNNVLKKLTSLRHLYFPLAFRSDTNDKLKLNHLKRLEILENFHAVICDAADLLELKNLQVFTGILSGNNVDLKNTISCMNRMKCLRHSSIVVKKFDSYSEERRSIVGSLLESDDVHALEIEGFLGEFPHPEGITGSNFTMMVFNGSEFSKDPMPILGKLPMLRSLVLCRDAFVGKEMICSEGDFPQLRSLKLATLQSLEKWKLEIGAMPTLAVLTIENCNKLEISLPEDGLVEMPTLEKLMIGSMPKGFQNKVEEMVREKRDLGFEEISVTFYDC